MREQVLPQAPLVGQVDFGHSSISRRSSRRPGRFGTAALSLVLAACGGNTRGPAPAQTESDSYTESPGIRLALNEAPDSPESINDKFDAFLAKYEGQDIEQKDIVSIWVDSLEIPEDSFTSGYDFSEGIEVFIKNPTDATRQFFEVIPYEEGLKPQTGDLVVILNLNEVYGSGQIAIATGETIEDEVIVFTVDAELDRFGPDEISGLLRPKVFGESTGETEGTEGEVLGVTTESMQKIYEVFFSEFNDRPFEWDLASLDNPDRRETWYQCMDIVYAWADRLGIPIETLRHEFAKDVLTPNPTTEDFFEVIRYKEGEGIRIDLGDIGVWGPEVGNEAGHTAIIIGAGDGGNLITFGQNYPEGSSVHQQEISLKGFKGVLRARGFGRPEEPITATHEAKQRIEALLAVESGDSNEQVARKMVLSKWLDALTTKQLGDETTLDTSILNLEEWGANFQRLLNSETITNDPLKIEFLVTGGFFSDYLRIGRAEIDNISLQIDDRSNMLNELSRKNGQEGFLIAKIISYGRNQTFLYRTGITETEARTKIDNLPPISEWVGYQTEVRIYLKNGIWTVGEFSYYDGGDKDYGISIMKDHQGWQDIEVVSKIFIDSSYGGPRCLTEREYEDGQGYDGCILRAIELG